MFTISEARETIQTFQELLDSTPREACHVRISSDAWTLAEIVGHLIDSASNNHQRFTRLSFGDLDSFPGYDAEPWVVQQKYDHLDFEILSQLWSCYNLLLLHLADTTSNDVKRNIWRTPNGPQTLEFLIEDYYKHLRLHIRHYEERLAEIRAYMGQ